MADIIKEWLIILTPIISGIAGLITVIILIRKFPYDVNQTDSTAANQAAQALKIFAESLATEKTAHIAEIAALKNKHAEETQEAYEKIDKLEGQVAELTKKFESMREEIKVYERVLAAYEDGFKRLSGQVISLGGTPVWTPPRESLERKDKND